MTAQSFFDDLGRAVQANPVPAALIGMGALWMLMGGGRTTAAAALVSGGVSRVADTLAPAASAVGSGASRIASGVSDLASSAKDGVSDLASGAASMAGQAFQAVGDTAADAAKRMSSSAAKAGSAVGDEAGSLGSSMADLGSSVTHSVTGLAGSVQGNLAETFQRQPLLVGAVGLLIGAAVAGAFPKTRFEEDLIGEQAGAMKEKVETLVSEGAENLSGMANRAVDALKQEAETQGLTPSALKESAAAIGKKAATAAKGVRRNGQQSAS